MTTQHRWLQACNESFPDVSIEYVLTKREQIFNFDSVSPVDACEFDYAFDYGELSTDGGATSAYVVCDVFEVFKDLNIDFRRCTMEYLLSDISILNGQAFRDFEIAVTATGKANNAASGITV